ncbi:MAG: hypothetical protein OEW37_00290 [Rhodospirillaceae bacterium]|nr:hypothetical protein [Rhodospirillaceae bacterium]
MELKFEGLKNMISFDGTEELVPVLEKVLKGWKFKPAKNNASKNPIIRIRRGPTGYERTSPWLNGGKMVLANPVDAVCDLLLDIERAFIADSGKLLALHAAAVELDGGLSVFPSTHNAGKSTLGVLLAARGARLFADDVTPLDPQQGNGLFMGVAPGFLPRLRLPLPDDLAPEGADFINSHAGPKSENFLYINLNETQLASLGQSAPVNRIILLERKKDAAAEIITVKKSEILKHTIMQSLNQDVSAIEILDNLNGMVAGCECLRLTYGRSEDAAKLLMSTFANEK